MDATHYFAGGVLCGAPSSRLAIHRDGVTCSTCLELISARTPRVPEPARVLDRYVALCTEEDLSTGEWSALPLRTTARAPRRARLGWMRRVLGHARR